MKNIKLLDCTLRDGGFVNDWNFGHSSMLSIYRRLDNAGVDYIEVGFIDDSRQMSFAHSANPTTKAYDEIYNKMNSKNAMPIAMIDFGHCRIENISDARDSFIDGIRVIFKKKDIDSALAYCKQIKNKGYKIFVQPVSITSYSDREMLDLIDKVNELNPFAMSIVDTYGLMHKTKLIKYFYLMDNNLNADISIGYHSHNNFQLAYSNAVELANTKTNRNIVIDSSVYGMGKSAGNANTELIAMYFNENFETNYDIRELLEIIDCEILKLQNKYSWGYSLPYYISALNDCHPNYVQFLRDKNTLSVKSIDEILDKIDTDKKLSFDKNYIEKLYYEYQTNEIDDEKAYKILSEELLGREILLLGPGKSITTEGEKIKNYIGENLPVIFSVNYHPCSFKVDYMFISNAKRYSQYSNIFLTEKRNFKLITTSNINELENEIDFKLNYSKLISNNNLISDTSMYMLISALRKIGVKKLTLAGFDGFSKFIDNYYDNFLDLSKANFDTDLFTNAVIQEIENFRKSMDIKFLTRSSYSNDEFLKYNKESLKV